MDAMGKPQYKTFQFQVWWPSVQPNQDDLDKAKLCMDDVQVGV